MIQEGDKRVVIVSRSCVFDVGVAVVWCCGPIVRLCKGLYITLKRMVGVVLISSEVVW